MHHQSGINFLLKLSLCSESDSASFLEKLLQKLFEIETFLLCCHLAGKLFKSSWNVRRLECQDMAKLFRHQNVLIQGGNRTRQHIIFSLNSILFRSVLTSNIIGTIGSNKKDWMWQASNSEPLSRKQVALTTKPPQRSHSSKKRIWQLNWGICPCVLRVTAKARRNNAFRFIYYVKGLEIRSAS